MTRFSLIMRDWENSSDRATAEVTNSLSSIAELTITNKIDLPSWQQEWKTRMILLVKEIAKADLGKNLTPETCLSGYYFGLNPLHSDKMEHFPGQLSGNILAEMREIVKTNGNCSPEQRSRLNTWLHISWDNSTFAAGILYSYAYAV